MALHKIKEFYPEEINLSENDIIEIARSGGLIGIELDQRIIGYNQQNKGKRFERWFKNAFNRDTKQNLLWAEPVWNNLIHIAETCHKNGLDPWKHICLGSDYDGIINPLNEYRTVSELDELYAALAEMLHDYWDLGNTIIPKNTGGDPNDIIYQFAYKNLIEFIKTNFR